MCPIADATLFLEEHTLNGKNVQDYPTTTLRRWDVSREAVLARSSCVYTKNV